MPGTEYILSGFGDFFKRRRVVFVEPLPNNLVCGLCGTVASRSFLLPCCHVACDYCNSFIAESGRCPLDAGVFTEDDVLPMTFELSYFEERRVLFLTGGGKGEFTCKLSELMYYLRKCLPHLARCVKCQQYVLRIDLIDHCLDCPGEALQKSNVSSSAVGSAGEKLTAVKNGHENIRDWASSKNEVDDGVITVANSVEIPITSLVCEMGDMTLQHRYAQDVTVLPVAKNVTYTPGPFRAASNLVAFIESYVFVDAYGAYNSLTGDKKEHVQSHGTHISAGYAFELQFQCRKQEDGEVLVYFTLILHESIWDALLEWPFSKSVTIIVTHPKDQEKDIRMPVSADSRDMVRRPVPGAANRGFQTETLNWRQLELQGFIYNNNIYVNVEFE
ncbi:hypothetical protein V5799_026540 [Amblyomma americanum]|uniref:TRAF1-6 MATH domain-containing protein n=1 Tax=Amblyomma americanum TaxID=6943 RepID=A0AAQ4DIA3_AMBAM